MSENDLPMAVAEKRKGLPIVWLLPLIALTIGGWLFYKSLTEAPVEIKIRFATGEGIELGKTEVKYKGIAVGRVSDINVNADLQSVTVTAEMEQRAKKALVEGTEFWLVKPEVSLTGISGLETLVSGTYITFRPGNTETAGPKRKFEALSEPPPLDYSVPGLHLTLAADELGSIFVEAPVMYSGISIGSVQAYELREDGSGVDIQIYIKPEYGKLVKSESRFYNSSGVTFSGDLSGFNLQVDSLASLFVGGITLFNSDEHAHNGPAPKSGDRYFLYDSFIAAQAGVTIRIRFPSSQNLKEGETKVKYKGVVVGVVKSLQLNDDMQSVTAEVLIKPNFEQHLTTGTKFWLVKPQLSLSEVTGLETLVTGSYVEVEIGEGKKARQYTALSSAPPLNKNAPGLHIRLKAESLGSIGRGTEVFYRKIPVGSVQSYALDKGGEAVFIDAFIDPQYAHLVTENSRFWNASGIDLEGGLSGIRLRTESMLSLIRGGISFSSPDLGEGAARAKNGDQYRLFESADGALESGLAIKIHFENGEGLEPGTEIKYQGIKVGEVTQVGLDGDLRGVVVEALLETGARRLAVQGSQFWLVKAQLGITNTENLGTLISGEYIAVKPGRGARAREFTALSAAPGVQSRPSGLNIEVVTPFLGSLKRGVKVYYRDVPVGEITGYALAENAGHVRVFVNIEERYRALVRENSVFWNSSGIDLRIGLFRGAELQTDSLESILAGGIAFATPDSRPLAPAAEAGAAFELNDKMQEHWARWKPDIPLRAADIRPD